MNSKVTKIMLGAVVAVVAFFLPFNLGADKAIAELLPYIYGGTFGALIASGLLSDQKPRPEVTRTWTTFLNQETGFLDGGEVLGKKFGYPVFDIFHDITLLRFGHGEPVPEMLQIQRKTVVGVFIEDETASSQRYMCYLFHFSKYLLMQRYK